MSKLIVAPFLKIPTTPYWAGTNHTSIQSVVARRDCLRFRSLDDNPNPVTPMARHCLHAEPNRLNGEFVDQLLHGLQIEPQRSQGTQDHIATRSPYALKMKKIHTPTLSRESNMPMAGKLISSPLCISKPLFSSKNTISERPMLLGGAKSHQLIC